MWAFRIQPDNNHKADLQRLLLPFDSSIHCSFSKSQLLVTCEFNFYPQ